MAGQIINPTRMELSRLRTRLRTAERGHKLLKDKRDELMKQFMNLVRESRVLRARVSGEIQAAAEAFAVASALLSEPELEQALLYPLPSASVDVTTRNIMGIRIPQYHFNLPETKGLPYGTAFTSGALDTAVERLRTASDAMLRLAQTEKAVLLMAGDIERTRRRTGALEFVMIPGLQENIRMITMKLSENERGNITRLMKVKSMIIEQGIAEMKQRDMGQ